VTYERLKERIRVAWADPARLGQILSNPLSNAIKYGSPAASVRIEIGRDGGSGLIAVSNEGGGMSREEISLLFARFRRTPSAARSGIEGTGLGLYIARELAIAHGGDITCESSLGGTTTFRVTSPLSADVVESTAPN
jgi:signal transduction histidine kinase